MFTLQFESMKNCIIANLIPKQLMQLLTLSCLFVMASIFCAELKAIPEDWPSADGMNDYYPMNAEFAQLSCKGSIQVSLDQNGEAIISPKMLLTDNFVNYSVFKVVVNQTGTNKVSCNEIGKHVTATVVDTTTGMSCWSLLQVEDKLAPNIICRADTISCSNDPFSVNYEQFIQTLDNCDGGHVNSYYDIDLEFFYCANPRYSLVVHLKWISEDRYGNKSYCDQDIYFKKASVDSVMFPLTDTVYCPNPDLSSTGVPLLFGDTVNHLCNLLATHEDDTIPVCGGMIKIIRSWTVMDWCTRVSRTEPQEILVADTTKPVFTCPGNTTIYTAYNSCRASYSIPVLQASDACSPAVSLLKFVRIDSAYTLLQGHQVNLDTGRHSFDYIVIDPCGNSDTCRSYVTVQDRISPTLICPPGLVVSLDPRGRILLNAKDVAARGLVVDNCCIDTILVRRMTPACGRPQDTTFRNEVEFCCDDIGDTLMLVLKATDCGGNMNFCMIEIYVQDKNPVAPPVCPGPITLRCTQDYTDLDLTGNYTVLSACLDTIRSSYSDLIDIDSCGNGTVRRRFYLTFPDGSVDSSCIQNIDILNFYRFDEADIDWPVDLEIAACINRDPYVLGSYPVNLLDTCGSVYFSYVDSPIQFTQDSCELIKRYWTAYSACTGETVRDTQELTLVSLNHSKLIAPRDTTLGNGRDSCARFIRLSPAILTGCSRFAQITNSYNNGGVDASGVYPVGITQVIFTAVDFCGILRDTTTVIVLDLENPSTTCRVLFVNMNPNDSIKLTARSLLDDYDDNCTSPQNLLIAFSNTNFNDTCRYITCADLQTIPDTFDINVFVKDSMGNIGSCNSRVHVADPSGHCRTAIRIGHVNGIIKGRDDSPMEGVQVNLLGYGEHRMTNSDGSYAFNQIVTNTPYAIQAVYNKEWSKGLSTQDIVLIQRHILGLETFVNGRQWIAADVDRNKRISVADISWMRKIILGKSDQVPSNTSWRFIDDSYVFQNIENPLLESIPEELVLNGFWQDTTVNYYAIKVGDVSMESGLLQLTDRMRKFEIKLDDKSFNKSDVFHLNLYAGKDIEMEGIQFNLVLDPKYLELLKIEQIMPDGTLRSLDLDEFHYDGHQLKVSMISGNNSMIYKQDVAMFKLVLKARTNGISSQVIQPGSELSNEVYQVSDVPLACMFSFRKVLDGEKTEISNWTVDPNPFKENFRIGFKASEQLNETGILRILNLEGKLIVQRTINAQKGNNELWIRGDELPNSGSYIFHFSIGEFTEQGKIVKLP